MIRSALFVAVLITLCVASNAPGPVVKGVTLMPDFVTSAKANNRDSGNSAPLGKSMLWVFDDTFTPDGLRSATGGWVLDIAQPNKLSEQVDSQGAPLQLYPFTPAELDFNNKQSNPSPCCSNHTDCPSNNQYCHCASGVDCRQRIAFWNARPYQFNSSTILLIYRAQYIGYAQWDFRNIGMGIAFTKAPPSTVAERVMVSPNNPLYIFGAQDIEWDSFTYANGDIYFTAGGLNNYCVATVTMAKVSMGSIQDKNAYQYWNGTGFSSSVSSIKAIGDYSGGLGSCMWSDHLKAYLTFSIGICTGGTKGLFRTAPNPWGPWSDATTIDFSPYGASSGSYAGVLHPEISSGSNVVVSYFVPGNNFSGKIVMRSVQLG